MYHSRPPFAHTPASEQCLRHYSTFAVGSFLAPRYPTFIITIVITGINQIAESQATSSAPPLPQYAEIY